MSENSTWKENESGLIIRRESQLARIPDGDSSPMSEIINRSLVHIQTSSKLAAPQRRPGEEKEFEIAPGIRIVMCWIPPGEFLMGSPEDEVDRNDNERQHRVRIPKGYWLAKVPITYGKWKTLMGTNPENHNDSNDSPVLCTSWIDICGNETRNGGFLGMLNQQAPKTLRFDLPTEAQWEYACRAGTTGPFYGDLNEIGWYRDNSDNMPHSVGRKAPNGWGLQDMLGNVFEWCSDSYYKDPDKVQADSVEFSSGSTKVIRGGSFVNLSKYCRVAARYERNGSDKFNYFIGFRLVIHLVQKPEITDLPNE